MSGCNLGRNQFVDSGLDDRALAGIDYFNFSRIEIDANDVVPGPGEASGRNATNISYSEDAEFHACYLRPPGVKSPHKKLVPQEK